jgi:predicted Zn-dependent peptidase
MIQPIALPRGAELLAEQVAGARSFSVGLWFPAGSRNEAPRERGFAHFIEHLLFKGTATRSALDLARAVDRVGGYVNAFTERDGICLHATVPAREWRLALDLLLDMAFGSSFPPEEVERERGVITSEILAALDDPEEASHDLLMEGLYPGQAAGRRIAGDPADIARAGREELLAWRERHLGPAGLVIAVSGPVAPAELAEELGGLLGKLPAESGAAVATQAEPAVFMPFRRFEPAAIEQVYLYEALPIRVPAGSAESDALFLALAIANGAIGESMSSRLFQGLRERLGLCYSVYTNFSLEREDGLWLAQASAAPADFPRLLGELDRELDALSGGEAPLREVEISESVSRLAGSFELALDDTEYRSRRLARQRRYSGQVLEVEETMAHILAVDPGAVAAAVRELFSGGERARFAYGHRVKGGAELLRGAGREGRGRG